MKVTQQPGYLLHARAFSESSLLVDLFTREHGRLMVLAKGARRRKSKVRGVLLPFQYLLVSWAGKGQLPILTGVEEGDLVAAREGGMNGGLRGAGLGCGYYMNELLLRLLHRYDAHEGLFAEYRRALGGLAGANGEGEPRRVLRIFEKQLLHYIGFGAVLGQDAETGEVIAEEGRYRYLVEKGPVRIAEGGDGEGMVVGGRTLRALAEERFSEEGGLREEELQEAKRLLRMLIGRQLNGRELKTRRVVGEMERYRGLGRGGG